MEIDKVDLNNYLQDIEFQADGLGLVGTAENNLWRGEFIAEYMVRNLTKQRIAERHICYINGCENIRHIKNCLCDEHLSN